MLGSVALGRRREGGAGDLGRLVHLCEHLGDCTIFHSGSYEKVYIKKMLRKYPFADMQFPAFGLGSLFNVLGAIRTNVYFPAYQRSEDIGVMPWSDLDREKSLQDQCIAQRFRWEESRTSGSRRKIPLLVQSPRIVWLSSRVAHSSTLGLPARA